MYNYRLLSVSIITFLCTLPLAAMEYNLDDVQPMDYESTNQESQDADEEQKENDLHEQIRKALQERKSLLQEKNDCINAMRTFLDKSELPLMKPMTEEMRDRLKKEIIQLRKDKIDYLAIVFKTLESIQANLDSNQDSTYKDSEYSKIINSLIEQEKKDITATKNYLQEPNNPFDFKKISNFLGHINLLVSIVRNVGIASEDEILSLLKEKGWHEKKEEDSNHSDETDTIAKSYTQFKLDEN